MFNENQKRLNKIIKITNIPSEMLVNNRFYEIKKIKKLDANIL
jgi:hypothetical protein